MAIDALFRIAVRKQRYEICRLDSRRTLSHRAKQETHLKLTFQQERASSLRKSYKNETLRELRYTSVQMLFKKSL
jgi:hypothetical protein